jgi:ATP-binding protein involved in chromosome partitioning
VSDQPVTAEMVLDALRAVQDPDLKRDIVTLGFVKNVRVEGGLVALDLELTTPACPVKDQLKRECEQRVLGLPGVEQVEVTLHAQSRSVTTRRTNVLRDVQHVLAVYSTKGGVGKTTVAVNLAAALHAAGAAVGLLDADVCAPDIPAFLGLDGTPEIDEDTHLLDPLEKHGLRAISMGLLVDPASPTLFRGATVQKVIRQFLTQVAWGKLDYLIIDMAAGNGDALPAVSGNATLSGVLIVTTPAQVSLTVAARDVRLFQQANVPILGLLENLAGGQVSTAQAQPESAPADQAAAARLAEMLNIRFLGQVPFDPPTAASGDRGVPVIAWAPDSPASAAYRTLAGQVASQLSIQARQGVKLPVLG